MKPIAKLGKRLEGARGFNTWSFFHDPNAYPFPYWAESLDALGNTITYAYKSIQEMMEGYYKLRHSYKYEPISVIRKPLSTAP